MGEESELIALVRVCLRIDRCSVLSTGVMMIDILTLNCLSKTFRLLLRDIKLSCVSIFLDAETWIANSVDVTWNSTHDKVVEMIVKRSTLFLQPLVNLHHNFISVTLR